MQHKKRKYSPTQLFSVKTIFYIFHYFRLFVLFSFRRMNKLYDTIKMCAIIGFKAKQINWIISIKNFSKRTPSSLAGLHMGTFSYIYLTSCHGIKFPKLLMLEMDACRALSHLNLNSCEYILRARWSEDNVLKKSFLFMYISIFHENTIYELFYGLFLFLFP